MELSDSRHNLEIYYRLKYHSAVRRSKTFYHGLQDNAGDMEKELKKKVYKSIFLYLSYCRAAACVTSLYGDIVKGCTYCADAQSFHSLDWLREFAATKGTHLCLATRYGRIVAFDDESQGHGKRNTADPCLRDVSILLSAREIERSQLILRQIEITFSEITTLNHYAFWNLDKLSSLINYWNESSRQEDKKVSKCLQEYRSN